MTREEIAEANKEFWKRKRAKENLQIPKPQTIAQELHGKLLEEYSGAVQYDPQTGIYTFPDGSEAKALTTFERVNAFVATDLSTQSLKKIRKWMAV